MKRPYSIYMYRALGLSLALSLGSLAGCSEGGKDNPNNNNNNNMNMTGDVDMAGAANVDMAGSMSGGDGGSMSTPDMTVLMGIPCIPGTYRCGAGLSVEICNSTGTAWLYSATCAVSCTAGLCTGACEPGTKRCNGKNVEACNPAGSAWNVTEMCSTFCDSARCAAPSLDVSSNKMLDGDQLVDGDIIIRTGATLTSPGGNLTLRTRGAILVEMGASIVVNPTGDSADGRGTTQYYSGGGGGYGGNGSNGTYSYSYGGGSWGSLTDISIAAGSSGGGASGYSGTGGRGGGVLRLIANKTITVAGQVTANGGSGSNGGGGGSGGGILVATPDKIVISGAITASGGSGSSNGSGYRGGDGGSGRVKLLNNGMRMISGSVNATKTEGLLPPLTITSSSHPNQDLTYNDDFPALQVAWTQAFPAVQRYYYSINTSVSKPPHPMYMDKSEPGESVMIPASDVRVGDNYFHIVPMDAMSNIGAVENTFHVRINSTPPTLASIDHPSSTTWYPSNDVFFNWTFPAEDKHFKGVYYVLDRYGETLPNSMGTFIPVTQKQLMRAALANGIWVLHMVPVDQRGYLTKTASHFRVNIGPDPGRGTLLGQVIDAMGKPVANAKVTVNRGLYTATTNSMGSYNFMTQVPAGAWEIKASSADGLLNDVKMDTITKDGTTTVNLTLK